MLEEEQNGPCGCSGVTAVLHSEPISLSSRPALALSSSFLPPELTVFQVVCLGPVLPYTHSLPTWQLGRAFKTADTACLELPTAPRAYRLGYTALKRPATLAQPAAVQRSGVLSCQVSPILGAWPRDPTGASLNTGPRLLRVLLPWPAMRPPTLLHR